MSFAHYLAGIRTLASKHGASLELRKPAKATALAKLASLNGVLVPGELGAAWRTSDGYEHNLFSRPGFMTGYEFLSVSEAIEERASFAKRAPQYEGYEDPEDRDPRIAPGWYQPGWLPFASFGGGTLVLLVDASPSKRGRAGQIIAFTHDPDEMTYVAASFSEYLSASLRWIKSHPDDVLALDDL